MTTPWTIPNEGLYTKLANMSVATNGNGKFGLNTVHFGDLTTVAIGSISQPTFPGYAEVYPSGSPSGLGSTIPSVAFATVTFTCTGTVAPQTIESVYLRGYDGVASVNRLLAIVALPGGPQVISQPGDSIVAQCTITDQRA